MAIVKSKMLKLAEGGLDEIEVGGARNASSQVNMDQLNKAEKALQQLRNAVKRQDGKAMRVAAKAVQLAVDFYANP